VFQNSFVLSLADVIRRYEAANNTEILQGTHRTDDHQVVRAQPNAAASDFSTSLHLCSAYLSSLISLSFHYIAAANDRGDRQAAA
jgi:hypothetical protein